MWVDRVFSNFMRSTPERAQQSHSLSAPEAGLLITAAQASLFLSLTPESLVKPDRYGSPDRTPRCDKDVRDLLVDMPWLTSVAISRSRLVSGRDVAASFVASVVAPHPFARGSRLAARRQTGTITVVALEDYCSLCGRVRRSDVVSHVPSPREIGHELVSVAVAQCIRPLEHYTSSRSRRHLGWFRQPRRMAVIAELHCRLEAHCFAC